MILSREGVPSFFLRRARAGGSFCIYLYKTDRHTQIHIHKHSHTRNIRTYTHMSERGAVVGSCRGGTKRSEKQRIKKQEERKENTCVSRLVVPRSDFAEARDISSASLSTARSLDLAAMGDISKLYVSRGHLSASSASKLLMPLRRIAYRRIISVTIYIEDDTIALSSRFVSIARDS